MSETYQREVLQSTVTVDWAAKSVKLPPLWGLYVAQFLCTLLPTLLIEGLLLLLFRFDWRKDRRPFLIVNLVTQGALSVFLSVFGLQNGVGPMFLILFVPAEAVIALAEAGLYRKYLQGHSKGRAFAYGLTANAVSAAAGWLLMEPLWRWVTTIS